MSDTPPGTVTQLLNQAGGGDQAARDRLFELIYAEIMLMARARLAREPKLGHREPESLVHEVYQKLEGQSLAKDDWVCRAQFFGYSKRAMWQICIDWIRSMKRKPAPCPYEDWMAYLGQDDQSKMLALDEAMQKLQEIDGRKAAVVRMKYIEEHTEVEIAEILGVSRGTVQNDWAFSRAFLHRELTHGDTRAEHGRDGED